MNQFLVWLKRRTGVALDVGYLWIAIVLGLGWVSGWFAAEHIFTAPGVGPRLLTALGFTFILTGSLIVHELGHLLISTRGVRSPQRLTFYLTGTAPSGYRTAESPGAEIRCALSGPVASGVVGGLALLPLLVVSTDSVSGKMLLWIGMINLLFGGINLLPAIPLDGGRVHRAIFWYLHDDYASGTRVTYLYGHLVAAGGLAIGLYILTFRVDLLLPGLWVTVLAWTVMRASRVELLRASLIQRAGVVRASDGVAGLNPTIRAAATIADAVDILLEQHANGPGLVRDRDRFVGTLTLEMVRNVPRSQWSNLTVREVMRPLERMISSEPGVCLLDVLRLQQDGDGNPVVVRRANGDVAGLVSADISPITLLHRAEERSFDMPVPDASHEQPPRS